MEDFRLARRYLGDWATHDTTCWVVSGQSLPCLQCARLYLKHRAKSHPKFRISPLYRHCILNSVPWEKSLTRDMTLHPLLPQAPLLLIQICGWQFGKKWLPRSEREAHISVVAVTFFQWVHNERLMSVCMFQQPATKWIASEFCIRRQH